MGKIDGSENEAKEVEFATEPAEETANSPEAEPAKGKILGVDTEIFAISAITIILLSLGVFALSSTQTAELLSPTELQVFVSGQEVSLSWAGSTSANVAGYNVYRSTVKGNLGIRINEKPIEATSYKIAKNPEGKYYYIVRSTAKDGKEDSNLNQVEAVVKLPPTIAISISEGAATNKQENKIKINAPGATECKLKVNDGKWGEWIKYDGKDLPIKLEEGKNTVKVVCKNEGGESPEMILEILVDLNAPEITLDSTSYKEYLFKTTLSAKDDYDPEPECEIYGNGKKLDSLKMKGKKDLSYKFEISDISLKFICTDDAGNRAVKEISMELEENKDKEKGDLKKLNVEMEINGNAERTRTREVTLMTSAPGAEQCRYANEDDYPVYTGWETYSTRKSWTLSRGEGMKIVYIECRSKDAIGKDSDSIRYRDDEDDEEIPPTVDYIAITGYITDENGVRTPNTAITGVQEVSISVRSTNARYGKLWNPQYIDPVYGPLNFYGVVDGENDTGWNENYTNADGILFNLIPAGLVDLPSANEPSDPIYTVIPSGIREVHFRTLNRRLNSTNLTDSIYYDGTAPNVTNLSATYSGNSVPNPNVRLRITATDDATSAGFGMRRMLIFKYMCKEFADFNESECEGNKFIVPYATSYIDSDISERHTYYYSIRVMDYAGHWSDESQLAQVNVTTPVNVTIGEVVWQYYDTWGGRWHDITDYGTIRSNQISAGIKASDVDRCYIYDSDGLITVTLDCSGPYNEMPYYCTVPTNFVNHTVYAICENRYGSTARSDDIHFRILPIMKYDADTAVGSKSKKPVPKIEIKTANSAD